MAVIKTIDLLPKVFRTDSNKKFLAATLDQMVAEPAFRKIDGYIGRRFAPTYKAGDSYIVEPNTLRQNYQLEPSVVIRDQSGNIIHYSNYRDLLNQLAYHGALTNDHDRLFANEQYNFDGLIDFDKFINFNQYYWLPGGPPEVTISASNFRNVLTYDVNRDTATDSFKFTGYSTDGNPLITLVRGNSYTFNVNSPNNRFWIQTQPGVTGTRSVEAEINSRDILGVERNGTDVGEVRFVVPASDAQDFYTNSTLVARVDFAVTQPYSSIQNHLVDVVNATGGLDGVLDNFNNKTIIFLTRSEIADDWTDQGSFDLDKFDQGASSSLFGTFTPSSNMVGSMVDQTITLTFEQDIVLGTGVIQLRRDSATGMIVETFDAATSASLDATDATLTITLSTTLEPNVKYYIVVPGTAVLNSSSALFLGNVTYDFLTSPGSGETVSRYEDGDLVPPIDRYSVFLIRLVDVGAGRRVIKLIPRLSVAFNQKVYIKEGTNNSGLEFVKNRAGFWEEAPNITAPLDTLYYQDDTDPHLYGTIKLIEPDANFIDVDAEIVGKKNYTAPNGVIFTNGLRVTFDNSAIPASYVGNSYIVEGVGRGIRLVSATNLIVPESYAADGLTTPDYLTVNRASADQNPWSRANRWFHQDLIRLSATYNNAPDQLIVGDVIRAKRPIIEFDPNVQLYNFGTQSKAPIDIIDFTIEDAFNEVEGKLAYSLKLPGGQSPKKLTEGTRIIFAADQDPEVRNKIYRVTFINLTGQPPQIHLVSEDTTVLPIFEVDTVEIVDNKLYSFVPQVTLSSPLPGLGEESATAEAVMSNTVIQSFNLLGGGTNYVATPDLQVNSTFSTKANANVVFDSTRRLDYIRVTTSGTGYATIPTVTIDHSETVVKTNANTVVEGFTLKLNSVSGIATDSYIVGPGIPGGSTITAINVSDDNVTFSIRATILASGNEYVIKDVSIPGNYHEEQTTEVSTTIVTLDDTSLAHEGMYISGPRIPFGTEVLRVLSPTQIEISQPISTEIGDRVVFVGRRATATAKVDGGRVIAVSVDYPGAGYTSSAPAYTVDAPASGPTAVFSLIMSDQFIRYITLDTGGGGYQLTSDDSVTVVNSVELETADIGYYGTTFLEFETAEQLASIQPGWLCFYVIETEPGVSTYGDFARTNYTDRTQTGPDFKGAINTFRDYMDIALTTSTVYTVSAIVDNQVQLNLPMDIRDEDDIPINLPAGSKIYFTCQSRYFTDDKTGTGLPIGDSAQYQVSSDIDGETLIPILDARGLQPNMLLSDPVGIIPDGVKIISVDYVNSTITVNQELILSAGTPFTVSQSALVKVVFEPTQIASIVVTEPGRGYTSAPDVTIEPTVPAVTVVGFQDSDTDSLLITVESLEGILIGSRVTSDYDAEGNGITVGDTIPEVQELITNVDAVGVETYQVRLDVLQPSFSPRNITFTFAAEAIARVASLNAITATTTDVTPDTYDAGNNVLVTIPTNKQQLLAGVPVYHDYWYDGTTWQVAQQKTRYNQAPLFDVFDNDEQKISDNTAYPGTKFEGTEIFGYEPGSGAPDPELGFPLNYRNFQAVGDILFWNYWDNDTFRYLVNDVEQEFPINQYYLRELQSDGTFRYRNIWRRTSEPTHQYQVINHDFDNVTNYFEIDIQPLTSRTVPYIKVYLNNRLLPESSYTLEQVGARSAVVVDADLLAAGDKVDIRIYSNQVSNLGYYEIPSNLDNNSRNENFFDLTLGQMRNHYTTMAENNYGLSGETLGSNNVRDLDIKSWAGSILQHASPLPFANLFLLQKDFNLVEAVEYTQKEYTKFKNRFLELVVRYPEVIIDFPAVTDRILEQINSAKNTLSPWYDSDMVPWGTKNRQTVTYDIINVQQRAFQIPAFFNDTQVGGTAVLIYVKNLASNTVQQLLKGIDYNFSTTAAAVVLSDNIVLTTATQLIIQYYTTTQENYVPETPTKLGLYPKYRPQIFMDTSYQDPVMVIQGHDGSLTPAFGDARDQMLLELEYRIYNNIKVNYAENIFDLNSFLPGKFRTTRYTRADFNRVLNKNFLKWLGNNQVDFSENTFFASNNPWTWNYKRLRDRVDGEFLPGFWRGIYTYFYDTDRPNLMPWEMLGFSERPDWWEDRYGPSPYTGSNQVLWDDLEAGYIHAGPRAGIDLRFARPNLSQYIPVDEFGQLISPEKLFPQSFDSSGLSGAFAVGDQAPAETAWRRSSEFPYAMQIALMLTAPAFYFGSLINTHRYYRNRKVDQLTVTSNNQRVTPTSIEIPNSGVNGSARVFTSGYINWVRDYLISRGIDPAVKISSYLSNIEINLSYAVAGYADKKYLNVLAEQGSPTLNNQSVVIPDENYEIYLHKSSPVQRAVYSAVIIEKGATGWRVSGYDLSNPYFTIVPSEPGGRSYGITASGASATVYRDFRSAKVTVPYGYEFPNRQQIVDFLVSYGRYLASQGFVFDNMNSDLETRQDWVLSAKEFLTWSQQGWQPGNILVLSPAFNSLKILGGSAVVDFVENKSTGSKVLDQNFQVIKNNQFSVTRDTNLFTLTANFGQTIGYAEFNLVQYEHVLIFDNQTVFNDIIYAPSEGIRQYRFKLVGNKTGNWTGALNPPGFIYNSPSIAEWRANTSYLKGDFVRSKGIVYVALVDIDPAIEFKIDNNWQEINANEIKTGLLPNFAFMAQKFENIYDLDNPPAAEDLKEFGTGLIGFRRREFFSDFSLSDETQAKFYQGYIKEKGTLNAITALTRATFNNITSDIDLYEEWAIRVGEYGAVDSSQTVEVLLREEQQTDDPTTIILLDNTDADVPGAIPVRENDVYRRPLDYNKNIILNRESYQPRITDFITAGYVNFDDIDGTIFDIRNYSELVDVLPNIGSGYKLWVAKDFDNDWNIYRVTETNNLVTGLRYNLDNFMVVEFDNPHDFVVGEVMGIKGFDPDFDGFYQIIGIDGLKSVLTVATRNIDLLRTAQTIEDTGILFRLKSVRFRVASDLNSFVPPNGWKDNDRVWIDNNDDILSWAVYQKANAWRTAGNLTLRPGEYSSNEGYGSAVTLSNDNLLSAVGSPDNNTGQVIQVNIVDPGENYGAPVVQFSLPDLPTGTQATATATRISGTILSANLVAGGSLYTEIPTLQVQDFTNTTSTSTRVASLFVTVANTATLKLFDTVSSGNIAANANVRIADIISTTNVRLTAVTTIASGDWIRFDRGTGGNLRAVLTPTTIASITVVDGGSGFVTEPRIEVVGGGGSGVIANVTLTAGVITAVGIVSNGSGFTGVPTVRVISPTPVATNLVAHLSPTSLSSVVVTSPGTGYSGNAFVTVTPGAGDVTGSGANVTVRVSNNSIGSILLSDPGSGYVSPPTVSVVDTAATGSGFDGFTVQTTGVVKTFLRNRETLEYNQIDTIRAFSPEAGEFGAELRMGTYTLAVGAPGSYSSRGAVGIYQFAGGVSWNSIQVLQPTTTNVDSRFGESLAMSRNENWLYVGAPGENRVYAYGLRNISLSRTEITLVTGSISYFINLPGVTQTGELIVIGDSGKVYQPGFEYTLIGVNILSFVNEAVLARDTVLYVAQQPQSSTFRCNVSQSTYALSSQAESSYSVSVIDSAGRIFVPEQEYIIDGQNIVFLDTTQLTAVNFTVRPLLSYYSLIEIIEPPDALVSTSRFGASLSCSEEGYQFIVGAPDANVTANSTTVSRAGRAYMFDRSYEVFQAFGNNRAYTSSVELGEVSRVTINGVTQAENVDYVRNGTSVIFDQIPNSGSKIQIDTNQFVLLQKLLPPAPVTQGRFGASVTMSDNNINVFVGSPGYNEPGYYFGTVYRYVNQGKVYGTYTSSVQTANLNLALGETIRINDQYIGVGIPNGQDFINQINTSDIPGVLAANVNGFFTLTGDNSLTNNKLNLLPGTGNVLSHLGIEVYSYLQEIRHPGDGNPERFGTKIKVGDNNETLIISSEQGATLKRTTFDEESTTFDKLTTQLVDQLKQAGAVYLFDFLSVPNDSITQPAQFVFSQVLQNAFIFARDNFGSSLDINQDVIMVGAEFNDLFGTNTGLVHLFTNPDLTKSWTVTRRRTDKVDIDYVNKIFAYDTRTQTIVAQFDYIDPAKGKILGVADQDIDFKTVDDPAVYNQATEARVTLDATGPWGDFQLGQVWWNLGAVKYIDYEQDTVSYRAINWGRLFPGSTIEVCEWISADVLPSQYVTQVGDGEPKYPDNTAYVERVYIDSSTGLAKVKYYYWVKNKRSITFNRARRNNSVVGIADLIENPQAQDIPYVAFIQENAFNVYNAKNLLESDFIALHIEYSKTENNNILHSEFQLVQENNPRSRVPERVIDKMIDSLSGEDEVGNIVPDLRLTVADRLGLAVRPRQTLIADNNAATKVFISFVNSVFAQVQVVEQYDLTEISASEPIPDSDSGWWDIQISTIDQLSYLPTELLTIGTDEIPGFRVLVDRDVTYSNFWTVYEWRGAKGWRLLRIQSYDNTRYWQYVNWYAEGYGDDVQIDMTVDTVNDLSTLNLTAGMIVRVLNNGRGDYTIYEIDSNLRPIPVINQNGTIALTADAFDIDKAQIGFDNSAFDSQGFSKNAAVELRNIFVAIYNGIFTGELVGKTNELFFNLVNYIFTEQRSLDWIVKTSFLTVNHKLRKLLQFPAFIKDNQDYYQQYINEVKPYRSQIREYVLDYEGTEISYSKTTDFDLYSYYDRVLEQRRNLDPSSPPDAVIIQASNRSDWASGYQYQIQSIEVTRGGSGYTVPPAVSITGGGGIGARGQAVLGGVGTADEGKIISVELTNPGSGYTSTPTVSFAVSGGTGATAYARLNVMPYQTVAINDIRNRLVRNITTHLKFDRTSYYSFGVKRWKPYTTYQAGEIITVESTRQVKFINYPDDFQPAGRRAYLLNKNLLGTSVLNEKILEDAEQATLLSGDYFTNANDRLVAYWQPGATDLGLVLSSEDAVIFNETDVTTKLESIETTIQRVAHSVFSPAGSNNQYVAIGFKTKILASYDGRHWTPAAINNFLYNIRGVASFAGQFWLAVGDQASVLASLDGVLWGDFSIDSFYYSPLGTGISAQIPAPGDPYGLVSTNTRASIDLTDVTTFVTTKGAYAMAVGNNGTILINPYTSVTGLNPGWYSIAPVLGASAQNVQYLRIVSKTFGFLLDPNGVPYLVKQTSNGYYYLDPTGSPVIVGYVFVTGRRGNSAMIKFTSVDDVINGYIIGYNYDENTEYPYNLFNEPAQVTGLGLNFDGQQLNGVAFTDTADFIVAVGSGGTLLWNSTDTSYNIQNGTGLSADTVGRILVDYNPISYKNFRFFSDSEFKFPLTRDDLADKNFNDIVFDGTKFIATGDNDLVLWGTPGTKPLGEFAVTTNTLFTTNIVAPSVVTLRTTTGTANIVALSNITTASTTIFTANLDQVFSNYMILAVNGNPSTVVANVQFTGTVNGTIPAGSTVAFTNLLTAETFTLTTALTSANGVNRVSFLSFSLFHPNGISKISTGLIVTHANVVPSIGAAAFTTSYGAMVYSTNKEPDFTWEYAPGFNRDPNKTYMSTVINRNTLLISQPLTANIAAGTVVTLLDSQGDPSYVPLLSNAYIGGNVLSFANTSIASIADDTWTVSNVGLASAIQPDTNVVVSSTYLYSGVRNKDFKDIPDNIKGVEYPGVNVTGVKFDDDIEIDTIIQSSFGDDALGVRAEDIVVDGGQFIDTYSSHAPEELIPGRLSDNLQIAVFTNNPSNVNAISGFRISYNGRDPATYYRISEEATTVLAEDLPYSALSMKLTDVSGLPDPNPDKLRPGVLFINGELISYYTINRATNTVGQLRRGVNRTGTPLNHTAGSLVNDASVVQTIATDVTVPIATDFVANNDINAESLFRADIDQNIVQGRIWLNIS
jgi:hypothetical protein